MEDLVGLETLVKDKNGKVLKIGDLVKAPVIRTGKLHTERWFRPNKNHGIFFLKGTLQLRRKDYKSEYYIEFNKEDIEELRKPKGQERNKQCVDVNCLNWNLVEFISRINSEDICEEGYDFNFIEI